MADDTALLLSLFWALSRSALPIAEKVAALEYAAATLRDHAAELELALLNEWYAKE